MPKDRPEDPPGDRPEDRTADAPGDTPAGTKSALSTLALSTKLEEDFVSPLTSLRGALEILRDVPDLSAEQRERFLRTALNGCARLEQSVEDLAKTVYAAGQRSDPAPPAGLTTDQYRAYAERVDVHGEMNVIEIDFSDFTFCNSRTVNEFYDVIECIVDGTDRDWYFVVNVEDCSVWPEAWVAFAHRGKRVNVTHSLGTVRYDRREDENGGELGFRSESYDPDLFDSRDAAFAKVEAMKSATTRGSKA